jgi:hypothetical protein
MFPRVMGSSLGSSRVNASTSHNQSYIGARNATMSLNNTQRRDKKPRQINMQTTFAVNYEENAEIHLVDIRNGVEAKSVESIASD